MKMLQLIFDWFMGGVCIDFHFYKGSERSMMKVARSFKPLGVSDLKCEAETITFKIYKHHMKEETWDALIKHLRKVET